MASLKRAELLWVFLVTGSACTEAPRPEPPADVPECDEGSAGCACYGNKTCDAGLVCATDTCIADERCDAASAGTATCPCLPDSTCDAGLACVQGVCIDEASCPSGSEGSRDCPCRDGVCDGGLVCSSGACVDPPVCPVGTVSCPCDVGNACAGGLTCDGGTCRSPPGCTPGEAACQCAPGGSCTGGLVCTDAICTEPAVGRSLTYFFGLWGHDGFDLDPGSGTLPTELLGPHALLPTADTMHTPALPLTVGDTARPRLVDFLDASVGFAVVEDVDGAQLHLLEYDVATGGWAERQLPADAAIRARMHDYLTGVGFGTFGDDAIAAPVGSLDVDSRPSAVLRALGPGRAAIARFTRHRNFDAECAAISCAGVFYLWSYDNGTWSEQKIFLPAELSSADALDGVAPASISANELVGYWLRRNENVHWLRLDLTSGDVQTRDLGFTRGFRVARTVVVTSATVCVEDVCTPHGAPGFIRQADRYDDPTTLFDCSAGACQILDLQTAQLHARSLPHPSSELRLCAGVSEHDGSGVRLFVYDSDIEQRVLEFRWDRATAELAVAPSAFLPALFGRFAGSNFDRCVGAPGEDMGVLFTSTTFAFP